MKLIHLIIIIIFFSCTKRQDKILPERRKITESVYTSVTIQPDSLYESYAIVAGILDQNLVNEGDLVSKNDPIIQITNYTSKLNSENARLALELAKENYDGEATVLRTIQEEIQASILNLKNDSINYIRQKKLWDQKIGSKIEYDTKKLNYELSTNNFRLLQSKYKSTKNALQNTIAQANNNYQTSLIATKDFTINSKLNGKVYALYKEPGEIVNIIEPLAFIGSANVFIIEMLVDEVDIVKISKNQKVIINLEAYSAEVFSGKVSKIYPKKDERNQTFKVEAVFDTPPKILYPGLSGEANIIIKTKDNGLTIPKEYLFETNKVITDDGKITIHLGLQNMEYVEIISGITKDTYIYKPE